MRAPSTHDATSSVPPRRWWRPAAAVVAVVVAIAGALAVPTSSQPPVTIAAVAALTAAALVAAVRPGPALVAAIAGFAAAVTTRMEPGLLVLGPAWVLFAFGAQAARRSALLVGLALLLGAAAASLAEQDDRVAVAMTALVLLAALSGGQAHGASRAEAASLVERMELALAAREAHERERRLEQRLYIAREVHDVIAHALTVVNLHAGVAERRARGADELVEPLGAIRSASAEALREMRRLVLTLRDDDPTPVPAAATSIAAMAEAMGAVGVDVRADACDDVVRQLRPEVRAVVHRVVQEALTNVARHSTAEEAVVTVEPGPPFTLRVVDRGPRRDGTSGSMVGIDGLRERVEQLGGELRAVPTAGGFAVTMQLDPRAA